MQTPRVKCFSIVCPLAETYGASAIAKSQPYATILVFVLGLLFFEPILW